MPTLQVKSSVPAPVRSEELITGLSPGASLEEELDAMVAAICVFDMGEPHIVIAQCMAFMGRCTEIYLALVRAEHTHRKARAFRTMQLQKVMDLVDFEYKAASRLVEIRRQEVELSK